MILVCNCSLRGGGGRVKYERNKDGVLEEIKLKLDRVERLSIERQVVFNPRKEKRRSLEGQSSKKYL